MSNVEPPQPQPPAPTTQSLAPGTYGANMPIPTGGSGNVSDATVLAEFAKMDEITLRQTQEKLYRKGWYGSGKPSGVGWKDKDINAFKDFYRFTQARQIDWKDGLRALDKAPDFVMGGSGRTIMRPSGEDLEEVLQRTALETMGKKLDDASVKQLVSSYQGVATQASGAEAPPSADVFFQNRIEQQYGADTDSYKYLNAISNVSKVLGSL